MNPEAEPYDSDDSQLLGDFNDWFISVIDGFQPSIVVAIARGAIRLLQLQEVPLQGRSVTILSDCALPFIPDAAIASQRVLLFDDSIIFGSTLSRTRDYLLARGAIVHCASYVVDRHSFFGETLRDRYPYARPSVHSRIELQAKHALWPDGIRRHHSWLVKSLLRTPLDYNVDFPTLALDAIFDSSDVPLISRLISKLPVARLVGDITTPASAFGGIHRLSMLTHPTVLEPYSDATLGCRPYSKVRFTLAPRSRQIRVRPIPQLVIELGDRSGDTLFSQSPPLRDMWARLTQPCHAADPYSPQAVFRLATAFVSVLMGQTVARQVREALGEHFDVGGTSLLLDDLNFIVGPDNARELLTLFSDLERDSSDTRYVARSVATSFPEDIDTDAGLRDDLQRQWYQHPQLRPASDDLIFEILGKIFLTLRRITDSAEAREVNANASRLDVGLSFGGLKTLIYDECAIDVSDDDLSFIVDACIDNGQAVPKPIESAGAIRRLFSSGEGGDYNELSQFKAAVHRAYAEHIQISKRAPLTSFDVHKLCVVLKDLFPTLPISTQYYTFGRRAIVGSGEEEIVAYLTCAPGKSNRPLLFQSGGGRVVVMPNPSFQSPVQPAWSNTFSKDFFEAFEYLAAAFANVGDAHKILLSTCRSHRHAYNAVAFEAHTWTHNVRGNFADLIEYLEEPSFDEPHRSRCVSSLYWCTRFVSEALFKFKVFHVDFAAVRRALDEQFKAGGTGAARFWEFSIDRAGFLDPRRDEEVVLRFGYLMPIVGQMQHLTAYAAAVLIEVGIITQAEVRQEFERLGGGRSDGLEWLLSGSTRSIAEKYNARIGGHAMNASATQVVRLPALSLEASDPLVEFRAAVEAMRLAFTETQRALSTFCAEYEVQEANFPYAPVPSRSRHQRKDGGWEQTYEQMFVLGVDIIGSRDEPATASMKDYLLETFARYRELGVMYESKSASDDFVACCSSVGPLWEIAHAVMLEGEVRRDEVGRFRGTRKGLFIGPVTVIDGVGGTTVLRDGGVPNALPQLFSMLTGIDEYCDERGVERNAYLITSEDTAQLLEPGMREQITEDVRTVRGKHFFGKCRFVDLKKVPLHGSL